MSSYFHSSTHFVKMQEALNKVHPWPQSTLQYITVSNRMTQLDSLLQAPARMQEYYLKVLSTPREEGKAFSGLLNPEGKEELEAKVQGPGRRTDSLKSGSKRLVARVVRTSYKFLCILTSTSKLSIAQLQASQVRLNPWKRASSLPAPAAVDEAEMEGPPASAAAAGTSRLLDTPDFLLSSFEPPDPVVTSPRQTCNTFASPSPCALRTLAIHSQVFSFSRWQWNII